MINRNDWPQTTADGHEEEGWLILSTKMLTLRYKLDSGPFTNSNLSLEWRDDAGTHQWKPGDPDDQNLGGVPASLDNRSTKAVTDPGPLSREGCYLLDDSHTALFDRPRSGSNLAREGRPGLVFPRVWHRLQVRPGPVCRSLVGTFPCCPATSSAPGSARGPATPARNGR